MKKYIFIFGLAFLFRLLLFPLAHHGDLNNNISWGNLALKYGLSGYYDQEVWEYSKPNQPPLTILTFAGVSWIYKNIQEFAWRLNNRLPLFPSSFIWFWEEKGLDLMVKLPGIIADLIIGYLVFCFFRNRKNPRAVFYALIWLFNPVVWYNSAVWGQTDSIVNLFGFMSIFYLLKKDIVKCFLFLTLSVLFKGSLALFIPVIGFYVFFQRYSWQKWLRAIIFSLLAVVFCGVWFHPKWNFPIWLVNLYTQRIFPGEIGYLTANSFNFWWLINPGKTLDSTIFWGISARLWGIIINLLGLAGVWLWFKRGLSEKKLFMSLAFISLLSFLFMTRIHERYLYPFFLPGTIIISFVPSIFIPFVLLSLSNLFNLYHLFWAPKILLVEKLFANPIFANILSYLNIIIFIWLLVIIFKKKGLERKLF